MIAHAEFDGRGANASNHNHYIPIPGRRKHMNAVELVQRLHYHRSWVNRNLLTAVSPMSVEQLRSPFPIGQGSIWKSLLHLYAAEYVWLETLLGDDDPLLQGDVPGRIPGNQQGEGGITGLEDLKQKWEALEERWVAYLQSLTPESFADIVYKKSTSYGQGKRYGTSRGDVLLHVCTHAQYTAAQIVNMLKQSGAKELPETMLITLARLSPNTQSASCDEPASPNPAA